MAGNLLYSKPTELNIMEVHPESTLTEASRIMLEQISGPCSPAEKTCIMNHNRLSRGNESRWCVSGAWAQSNTSRALTTTSCPLRPHTSRETEGPEAILPCFKARSLRSLEPTASAISMWIELWSQPDLDLISDCPRVAAWVQTSNAISLSPAFLICEREHWQPPHGSILGDCTVRYQLCPVHPVSASSSCSLKSLPMPVLQNPWILVCVHMHMCTCAFVCVQVCIYMHVYTQMARAGICPQ